MTDREDNRPEWTVCVYVNFLEASKSEESDNLSVSWRVEAFYQRLLRTLHGTLEGLEGWDWTQLVELECEAECVALCSIMKNIKTASRITVLRMSDLFCDRFRSRAQELQDVYDTACRFGHALWIPKGSRLKS